MTEARRRKQILNTTELPLLCDTPETWARLAELIQHKDTELAALLHDLGPAERRHWEMFYALAARGRDPEELAERWRGWLEYERDLTARAGLRPTVHG